MSETNNFKLGVIEDNNLVTIVNDNFAKVDQALLDVMYTHPDSGVKSGTYGTNSTAAVSPAFGGTFSVPGFAVNKEGHVTSASTHTVRIPSATATTSAAGLMSAADKAKVNTIQIESGKWTPDNAGGGTTTASLGYYRRCGDIVFVSGYIRQSTSVDNMIIDGMPYSPSVNSNGLYKQKMNCVGQFTTQGGMKNACGNTVYTGSVTADSGMLRFIDDSYYGASQANNSYCGKLGSDHLLVFSAVYMIGANN